MPVVAASITETMTTVSARPPRRLASSRRITANIFSVTPESLRKRAISTNSGMATRT